MLKKVKLENFNNLTFKTKFTTLLAIIFFTICVLFVVPNMAHAQTNDNNWASESYIMKNYYAAKKAFDSQKQALVDAYNNQINKISIYGLKTKDAFHGLRFKTDVFKNNLDSLKTTINSDFENVATLPSYKKNERKAKISKLVDKLNSNVTKKMAKIKAFYDAKISKIYDSLQKGQKVDFDRLKEYSTNNESGNFSRKDFNFIGSEIKKDKIANSEENSSRFRGVLIAIILALLIFLPLQTLIIHIIYR